MAATIEIGQEKERLTNILSTQYSQSLIAMDEYERLLDFVIKTETNKEIEYIRKIIATNETYALKERTGADKNPPETPRQSFFMALIGLLVKKQRVKKIKIFSGTYELRLHDIDFVENKLILKIKNFSGNAFIYIGKNTVVENNIRIFGGECVINEQLKTGGAEVKNRLIINGSNFSGVIRVICEN